MHSRTLKLSLILTGLVLFTSANSAEPNLKGEWNGSCHVITKRSLQNKDLNIKDAVFTSYPDLKINQFGRFLVVNLNWKIKNQHKFGYSPTKKKLADHGKSTYIGLISSSPSGAQDIKLVSESEDFAFNMTYAKGKIRSSMFRSGPQDALVGLCSYRKVPSRVKLPNT